MVDQDFEELNHGVSSKNFETVEEEQSIIESPTRKKSLSPDLIRGESSFL